MPLTLVWGRLVWIENLMLGRNFLLKSVRQHGVFCLAVWSWEERLISVVSTSGSQLVFVCASRILAWLPCMMESCFEVCPSPCAISLSVCHQFSVLAILQSTAALQLCTISQQIPDVERLFDAACGKVSDFPAAQQVQLNVTLVGHVLSAERVRPIGVLPRAGALAALQSLL